MRVVRLASLLVVLALAGASHAAARTQGGPTNLHGFLLRADEPPATTFTRTPSFAWDPVPGAQRYQFQLSTSNTFRDNGVLYNNSLLLTPVESPPLTLPWITGSPHALYARVRAFLANGDATPWSASFGFDVEPASAPRPLPSYPGVLRWTPIEGADTYEVWLLDANKVEWTNTNVLDEREFYTFHQAQSWIGTIRWRVRALRSDTVNYRINGFPVSGYGAWSPIYSSTNPATSSGKINLIGTVSDVFSDGSSGSPAHETMPAFVWSGNQTLGGQQAELYRVYVFTDKQCLNRVFTSPVVGTPSYAPRLSGPLSLPSNTDGTSAARSQYLGDGKQSGVTYDGEPLDKQINEQQAAAKATTEVPGIVPSFPGTTPPLDPLGPGGSGSGASGGSSSGSGGGSSGIKVLGDLGPPVDLWDTDWPQSGYYWTVVPVAPVVSAAVSTTVSSPGSAAGDTTLPITSTTGFKAGDTIVVGSGSAMETATVTGVSAGTLTLGSALKNAHAPGELVERAAGAVEYRDLELAQDVCAAGRIQRFGISSETTLTSGQVAFATGLSSSGLLVSATRTPTFYGQPLIAWTPAFNAGIYEVQWSKKAYPFVAETDPRTGSKGYLTFNTSAVLPLTSGTWYYRVRGLDFNLPTGVQQMSWSDPQAITVAQPTFRVAKAALKKPTFKIVGGSKKSKARAKKKP